MTREEAIDRLNRRLGIYQPKSAAGWWVYKLTGEVVPAGLVEAVISAWIEIAVLKQTKEGNDATNVG